MLGKGAALSAVICVVASAASAQEAVDAEDALALEPIIVEGDVADTSNSYALPVMRSATKTDAPLLETPQAVSVLTRKQFDDQNAQTVGQALRYTAGVLSEVDASTRYDSVFLRGFGGFGASTHFVSFLDGLRLPRGQSFAQTSIDPFLLDRVDVLKGPSALLYGQSSPGGLVNMVSRGPNGESGGEARVEYGSHDRIRAGAAHHGVIDEDGDLQYSVAAIGENAGSRYDDVKEESYAVGSNLVWTPSDRTRLTLGGFVQNDPEGGYFNSIYPTFLSPEYAQYLDRDLNVGDPSFESFERTQWGVSTGLEHAFSSDVTLRSKLRYAGVDSVMKGIQMGAPISADGKLTRLAVISDEEARNLAWDTNVEYAFETGPLEHRLLGGVDLLWNQSDWRYDYTLASQLDVTAPLYDGVSGPFLALTDSLQTTRQTGVYLTEQASFGGFRAVLGLRHDWIETETENRLTDATAKQESGETSYRAGLLYLFDNGVAPYASYATSFQPTIGVDASGDAFVPTRAEQWELGVKYQPANMDALFTLAAFDIRQENVLTPGPTPGFNIQTGEIRSRGVEFEARGAVTEQLEVIGSLTWLDTEVTKSTNTDIIGNRPQAVPQYFGSLWVNYAFDGALDGLELGGGVRFVGSSFGDDDNAVEADSYTLFDLGVSYDLGAASPTFEGTELTLNMRNVFDETYYSSCSYDFYCQYGEGQTFLVGLRQTW